MAVTLTMRMKVTLTERVTGRVVLKMIITETLTLMMKEIVSVTKIVTVTVADAITVKETVTSTRIVPVTETVKVSETVSVT